MLTRRGIEIATLKTRATRLQQLYHLVSYSAWSDLKAQVSRLYLGFAWWIIEPLLYMAVFYVVFGILFERGGPGYPAFLLTGLVAYRWFDTNVRGAMESIARSANLIQQVYVPKYAFPLAATVGSSIKFLLILALLIVFLITQGYYPDVAWLALPALVGIEFLLSLFVGTIVAILIPFLPDLRILVSNGLLLLLFLSGVFYDGADIPQPWQTYFFLNPLAILIQAFRHVLIDGQWPDWGPLLIILVASLAGLAGTLKLHSRVDLVYGKRLL